MLGIVATRRIKPGMAAEFEAVARHVDDVAFEAHRTTEDYMDGRVELMRLRELPA